MVAAAAIHKIRQSASRPLLSILKSRHRAIMRRPLFR
jgi:hypothetical protein